MIVTSSSLSYFKMRKVTVRNTCILHLMDKITDIQGAAMTEFPSNLLIGAPNNSAAGITVKIYVIKTLLSSIIVHCAITLMSEHSILLRETGLQRTTYPPFLFHPFWFIQAFRMEQARGKVKLREKNTGNSMIIVILTVKYFTLFPFENTVNFKFSVSCNDSLLSFRDQTSDIRHQRRAWLAAGTSVIQCWDSKEECCNVVTSPRYWELQQSYLR